jgi:hypothetical protein
VRNANPGSLFPVQATHPLVWHGVQNALALERVKKYASN